jgi:hypothetical protein
LFLVRPAGKFCPFRRQISAAIRGSKKASFQADSKQLVLSRGLGAHKCAAASHNDGDNLARLG